MCELEHLVSKVRGGESALSPIRILSGIQKIGNHLGYGKQEDAHEFLRLVIDTMQSIFLDEAGGEKVIRTAHSITFIQQLFGGYLQTKVKCKKCQYESNRYELIMDLVVEVHGSIESLEDALDQFTGAELLDGENEYKFNRCKSYVMSGIE
jgi:ubiquitin carboxyl-terminal hydrolase 36/42